MLEADIQKFDDKIDDAINDVYNCFYSLYMKKTKNINVSKNCNYKNRKTEKPNEWYLFERLYKLCLENNFVAYDYINFIFSHNDTLKCRNLRIFLNIKNVCEYKQFIDIEKKYKNINSYIEKSYRNILEICNENNLKSFTEFLKFVIKNKNLMVYVKGGYISRYSLVLIKNFEKIYNFLDSDSKMEFNGMIKEQQQRLLEDSIAALKYCNNLSYLHFVKKIDEYFKNDK